MKSTLKKIIVVVLVLGLGSLTYSLYKKIDAKNTNANNIASIPGFSYTTLNGLPFTNKHLVKNTPTVFIYFNSECDFCQHEAQDISSNIDQLQNLQLLFISQENVSIINQFATQHQLNNLKKITFLHDSTGDFARQFDTSTIPTILVYDERQNLFKKHKGQLNSKGILKILNH